MKRLDLDLSTSADPEGQLRHALADDVEELRVRAAWAEMPTNVLAEKPRTALIRLSLIEKMSDCEPACHHKPDALWKQVPNLEKLLLRSERPLFHSITHPTLEMMELEVHPFCDSGHWDLPSLRTLTYKPYIESECGIEALDSLWGQRLPTLRDVSILGIFSTGERTLSRPEVWSFLAGLERFWIPIDAILPDDQLEDLCAHLMEEADHLKHLKKLVITGVDLDVIGDLSALRQKLPIVEISKERPGW